MEVEFDPAKDRANIAKHGVSLARAADLTGIVLIEDARRNYGETRYRAWDYIEGVAYSLAFTIRGDAMRPISLRRASTKEMERYAEAKGNS